MSDIPVKQHAMLIARCMLDLTLKQVVGMFAGLAGPRNDTVTDSDQLITRALYEQGEKGLTVDRGFTTAFSINWNLRMRGAVRYEVAELLVRSV